MLSEISQMKTNTACFHLYVESKNLLKPETDSTDPEKKLVDARGEEDGGKGKTGEGIQRGTVSHIINKSQDVMNGVGNVTKDDIITVWCKTYDDIQSLCCPPETEIIL